MRKNIIYVAAILLFGSILSLSGCNKDTEEEDPIIVDPGTSTTELLVKKFSAAPTLDGSIDQMWGTAQTLTGTTEVPELSARNTYLNGDGAGTEENLGLFAPYSGEKYDFKMRSGYFGEDIYFLLEWDDAEDSKDRQSWYFDASDKLWKGEHKYANDANDKFYEDKFAFLFPIGDVTGFSSSTCYATCHSVAPITNPKDKHTRHYLTTDGQKIDMWHWKRVRGTYNDKIDDQMMNYDAPDGSARNGRHGDETGEAGYANNSQSLPITGTQDTITIPLYVIPTATNYYWIGENQFGNEAKMITAVDADGVLTYDGGIIDPAVGGFEQGTGDKRIPSVTTKDFTLGRADLTIKAVHTGTGWICEFTRKLDTEDADDVVFEISKELPFGLAIFNNAAIAHAIKPNLNLKFEQ